jgi:hypothetical protein
VLNIGHNNNNNNNNNETKSEIIAAQDQALQTKYHETKILQPKQTANADYVNDLMRRQNIYIRAHFGIRTIHKEK